MLRTGKVVQIADYARLIAVAFPLTSTRRSSAYAGQMIYQICARGCRRL